MKIQSGWLKSLVFACAFVQAGAYGAEPAPGAAEATASSEDALGAHALLERAIAHYQQDKAKALLDFDRSPEFVDGESYVYVVSTDGVLLASGGPSSALINQNVSEFKDAAGKPFFREMLQKARTHGAGVVQYQWLNRVNNKVERKVTYFQKADDRIIAVGYYIARATPAQAQALLGRAVEALQAHPDQAIDAFNRTRGEFSEDDLYVFVVDLADQRFRAHGANPRLIGSDAQSLRDPDGRPIVQQMIEAVSRQDQAELDYVWPNPVTGRIESKHTFLRKVGAELVGVGYYTR